MKKTLPSLETSFTPLPHAFIEELFRGSPSREELLVSLYCFYRGYGWKREQAVLRADHIARETGLAADEAARGLAAATGRGTLLALPLGQKGEEAPPTYLLNTEENARFVHTYCSGESVDGVPAPVVAAPAARAPEEEFVPEGVGPDELSPDDSSPAIPYEDELEPRPERAPRQYRPAAPPAVAAPSSEASAGEKLPYEAKTVEMLVKIVGRPLTKDERDRLADLGATDDELIRAMRSLLSKTTEVYSSDLVIYERERLLGQERQMSKNVRQKEEREKAVERQKACRKCDGLGYLFVGVNNIRECDCRKDKKDPK